jgi:hypothetical protein
MGLKKASGIPKELTRASACGRSSAHSFGTSFLTVEAFSVDKYPYRRKAASSSTQIKAYNDLKRPKTSYRRDKHRLLNRLVLHLYVL